MTNYSQKAEATLAVSSTGSGPTPPRGMSRTAPPRSLKLMLTSAPLDLDGRNARPPEGKRDAEAGRANTTAARNGRSFILAMVRRLDFEVSVKSYFWACLSPVLQSCSSKNEHILCRFFLGYAESGRGLTVRNFLHAQYQKRRSVDPDRRSIG